MLWRCPNGIEHEEQNKKWTHLYTLSAMVTCIGLPPGVSVGQNAWFQLVRDYTSRGITYSKDKFPAISGIMTVLRRMTDDMSYAGLWKRNFLKWLLWIPKHDIAPFKRPDKWIAPSWSFMSGDGPVDYSLGALSSNMNASLREFCATLEECSVTPKGLNPLGELTAGFARITGTVVALDQISRNSEQHTYFSCSVQMRDRKAHPARVLFDVDTYERCDVLVIAPAFGIATICTNEERSEYVRVGLVVIQTVDLNDAKGVSRSLDCDETIKNGNTDIRPGFEALVSGSIRLSRATLDCASLDGVVNAVVVKLGSALIIADISEITSPHLMSIRYPESGLHNNDNLGLIVKRIAPLTMDFSNSLRVVASLTLGDWGCVDGSDIVSLN
jgi:hypothetical protein